MPRDTTAAKLVGLMVGRFRQLFTSDMQQAAQALELTPRQAVTLASLVEKETAQPSERPIVAAVYVNRLKIGMGMQADPTVIYALQRAGRYDGNLRRDDLSFDSPYNTYRYAGLPPGPIASPGLASLQAAVAPAAVDYLYFVSRNDGSHVFARTLVEHNENVRQYQVLYFREQRAKAESWQVATGYERLVKMGVGLAGALSAGRTNRSDAAGTNPTVELEPMLERAAAPDELGRVVGELHVNASVARRPHELEAGT